MQLFNTLTRQKEEFVPVNKEKIGVYCCGPTVYHFAHIGNLRAYVSWDILVKTLRRQGYAVEHVMNITDVGHLTSDADEGEDKMILAMKREGKSPWDIAKFYEVAFFEDCAALNIEKPSIVCRATEHIAEMIKMVQALEKNGYTYTVDGNVYFDTAKFKNYGQLWGGKRTVDASHARVEGDSHKRNAADFVLWFGNSKFKDQAMKWDSPWGVGFPGWHIECSAMATKYLGEHFDIHCGGTDHISVHHTNEIAQAEGARCACGHAHNANEKDNFAENRNKDKRWVNTWLHNEFLLDQTGKMSKSKGDFLTLDVLKREGINALAYRLFLLGGHYRSQLTLNWEALRGAQTAWDALREKMQEWSALPVAEKLGTRAAEIREKFDAALADDLNTPVALACLWESVRDGALSVAERKALILSFDEVLGLGLGEVQKGELTAVEKSIYDARAAARAAKEWKKSDELRDELAKLGVIVKDTAQGQEWTRR